MRNYKLKNWFILGLTIILIYLLISFFPKISDADTALSTIENQENKSLVKLIPESTSNLENIKEKKTINIDSIIKNGISSEYPIETNKYAIIKGEIQPNQFIAHILKDYNINGSDILRLEEASKNIFNIGSIKEGRKYSIIYSKESNSAECFIYEKSKTKYVSFDFRNKDSEIKVAEGEKEVFIKERTISGVIGENGSLWKSLTNELGNENHSASLIMTLANNIYAWTIDFDRAIQPTDKFMIYYEEKFVGKECIGIGKVLASSFTYKGATINAFRFEDHEGQVDYFDENGQNLRKAFLKSPIAFNYRISSNFGKRKHPISGKWKDHNGTDYAASTGTNILATSDGIVEFAGRNNKKRGNGIFVKLRHNGPYKTLYLHMSKKLVNTGDYVKQGEVIGKVGSTGYATGPHLHYELWVNDNQVDATKYQLPPSLPIRKENVESFKKIKNQYLTYLNAPWIQQ